MVSRRQRRRRRESQRIDEGAAARKPPSKNSKCFACQQPVVWLKTQAGKNIPVEPDSVRPEDRDYDPSRHKNHFADCEKFLEKKRAEKDADRQQHAEPGDGSRMAQLEARVEMLEALVDVLEQRLDEAGIADAPLRPVEEAPF